MRKLTILALFLGAAGCGTPPENSMNNGTDNEMERQERALESAAAICDGSDDLRFGFATVGGGPLGDEEIFYLSQGHARVAVDGRCQLWTNGTETINGSSLQGRLHVRELTHEELADILIAVQWEDWEKVSTMQLHSGCSDAGGWALRSDAGDLSLPQCLDDRAPQLAHDVQDAVSEKLSELTEDGAQLVVTSDIRYRIDPQPVEESVDFALPWPTEMGTLADSLHAPGTPGCPGTTSVATGKQADVLRALRDSFVKEAEQRYLNGIVVTDGATNHRLMMRDVGPGENAVGKVAFPQNSESWCE